MPRRLTLCDVGMMMREMRIEHTNPFDWSALSVRSGTLASTIRTDSADDCRIALLGVPDDTGVGLNHGRVGAAAGPGAFRAALARYGSRFDGEADLDLASVGVFDAGDVEVAGDDLAATHKRVEHAVGELLDADLLPVVIGGGHDLTLPGVSALCRRMKQRGQTVAGMNIDPHLDMRPEVGSGMAFARLLSGEIADAVVPAPMSVIGLGLYSNAREHLDWARRRSVRLVAFDGNESELLDSFHDLLHSVYSHASNVFASFDLDVLDASVGPGVSALNPMGLGVGVSSIICRALGRLDNLRYFDLMELNPSHDDQGRTARIAAHLFLSFLAGFTERGEPT